MSPAPLRRLPPVDLVIARERLLALASVTDAPPAGSNLVPALAWVVAGLHQALSQPELTGDPDGVRHVHAALELPAGDREVPGLAKVEVTIESIGALGSAHGVAIRVDALDEGGRPLLRSTHLVQVRLDHPPRAAGRATVLTSSASPGPAAAGLVAHSCVVSGDAVARYVEAAADTSAPHRPREPNYLAGNERIAAAAGEVGAPVVPGMLTLALLAHHAPGSGPIQAVEGRFSHPLSAGATLEIAYRPAAEAGWHRAEATSGGRIVVRRAAVRRAPAAGAGATVTIER